MKLIIIIDFNLLQKGGTFVEQRTTYNTKQKETILKCFEKNKNKHMTADEVYLRLKNAGSTIGKATVYRNLNSLVEDKVLKKFEVGHTACFQYADADCDSHYHLKCVQCDKVYHIESDEIHDIGEMIKDKYGFDVDNAKIVFYGKCKKCN